MDKTLKIVYKLVHLYHICKIVIGDCVFKIVKTVIINYYFMIKVKIMVGDYILNFFKIVKITITNYYFRLKIKIMISDYSFKIILND